MVLVLDLDVDLVTAVGSKHEYSGHRQRAIQEDERKNGLMKATRVKERYILCLFMEIDLLPLHLLLLVYEGQDITLTEHTKHTVVQQWSLTP